MDQAEQPVWCIDSLGLDFNDRGMGLTYDINISHLEPGSKSKGEWSSRWCMYTKKQPAEKQSPV